MSVLILSLLFLGVIGFMGYCLYSQAAFIEEILGHNMKMAEEYNRIRDEYKQYRIDVVESLSSREESLGTKDIIGN